jgi:UDP-N-acetylglucosamine 2-epimerase (non-hydrolysing)
MREFAIKPPENMRIIDPVGYVEIMELMSSSVGVLTDSGTIVEETSILGVPSIQMRTSTERPQVYDSGSSIKYDPHFHQIEDDKKETLEAARERSNSSWNHGLGDGKASEIIVSDLLSRSLNDDWRGHAPKHEFRPIERNYGYGSSGLGDKKAGTIS